MKYSLSVPVFTGIFLTMALAAAGASILEAERTFAPRLEEIDYAGNPTRTRLTDRVLCVDGLKLFQTIGPAWGNGASPVVSTIQLYEERGGKVFPAKCAK